MKIITHNKNIIIRKTITGDIIRDNIKITIKSDIVRYQRGKIIKQFRLSSCAKTRILLELNNLLKNDNTRESDIVELLKSDY